MVERGEQAAAGHVGRSGRRVHAGMPEQRQVDLHASVASRFARETVASTFDGQQHLSLPRESHGILDIGNAGRLDDQRRMEVDRPVEDPPRFVVAVVSGQQKVAAQTVGKLLHSRAFE
jgi:hypothetical protein